ncbi:MAG: hypothetical protein DLM73_13195 [Chthoniobacterales bacterium]|nr:MAG: hypothetical protein DLM73_13195 [Chthoniobacterales bacterium]
MDPVQRARFNADFTADRYAKLLRTANESEYWPVDFRISESPIFLSDAFADEVEQAAQEIVSQLRTPEFALHARTAIPAGLEVPGESPHPIFLAVDFAICEESGRFAPRLIELQGFPSLYAFQLFLVGCMRSAYPAIPSDWIPFFGGFDEESYVALLRRVIIADADTENVILLEVEPEKQNTRIDFACTDSLLGVRPVSLTEVTKRGRQLFYQREGREVRIERIYNRVIFDELLRRPELKAGFDFQDDLDVTWVGHPNWYFRISKHTLPFLKSKHASPAFFADEFPAGEQLTDFVLKPLYSFAGLGVDLEPTREKLAVLSDPRAWILQKKVEYADFVPTPDGPRSKAEIRMMFVWPAGEEPMLVNNLVRMSQGKMMGVKFNKDKTWVGSSIALRSG